MADLLTWNIHLRVLVFVSDLAGGHDWWLDKAAASDADGSLDTDVVLLLPSSGVERFSANLFTGDPHVLRHGAPISASGGAAERSWFCNRIAAHLARGQHASAGQDKEGFCFSAALILLYLHCLDAKRMAIKRWQEKSRQMPFKHLCTLKCCDKALPYFVLQVQLDGGHAPLSTPIDFHHKCYKDFTRAKIT